MNARRWPAPISVVLKKGTKRVLSEDSSIKGFGTSPNRLPSTDEIIEVIDHLIPHFLFKVRGAKESLIVVIVLVLSVPDSIP